MPWKPITYTNTDDSLMAMLLFEDKAILLCNCSTTFFYWCWKAVIILVVSNRKFVDTFPLLFFFFFVSSAAHEVDLILGACHRCSTDKHEKRGFFFFFYPLLSSRFSLRKLQTILTHVQGTKEQDPLLQKKVCRENILRNYFLLFFFLLLEQQN